MVLVAGAAIMPDLPRAPMIVWIGLNGAVALAAALSCAPSARQTILARFRKPPDAIG
jgi:hypothetical protein